MKNPLCDDATDRIINAKKEQLTESQEMASTRDYENYEKTTSSSANLVDEDKGSKDARKSKGTSDLETLMHVIKANIGTGVLAMPLAFKNAGLVLASITLWMMAFICVHCMHLLLNCYKHVTQNDLISEQGQKMTDSIGYDDVVELVFKEKCRPDSRVPKYARGAISIFLVFAQLGFCCVYLVFVPTNIKQVIDFYHPSNRFTIEMIMSIVVVLLLLFCLIRDLKFLAPFSALANALMIGSMGVILVQLFVKGSFKKLSELDMVAPIIDWPIYFSTAIYAFEGISLVLPVYHGMREKRNYTPWNGVLNTAMTMVAVMYFSIGFFGYMKYGRDAMASITLNLDVNNLLFQIIKILFAVAIFISYNLQFIVAAEIIWNYFFTSSKYLQSLAIISKQVNFGVEAGELTNKRVVSLKLQCIEILFRSCLILFTFGLAVAIPRIDLFINLVGAISCANLALIIPPLLDMMLFWRVSRHPYLMLVKNVLIMLFGVYIFVAGTTLSIRDIVKFFKSK